MEQDGRFWSKGVFWSKARERVRVRVKGQSRKAVGTTTDGIEIVS